MHSKQTSSQMERQSFHTQQSAIQENLAFQFNENTQSNIENTKIMVEKFTSRLNNISIPSSLKLNQKQNLQDVKGIENYYGPYNLSFITKKHPQLFLKGIQKYLEIKYQFIQMQNYQNGFTFSLNEQKIDLKLYRIENLEIFYCHIHCVNSKNNSNYSEFNTIICDLQSNFQF
ncbi:unnamed protein product [Paramecium sonneborni]|uniref:Uncharacterized protein n=1 Tax=Paramecium sonneborni TaxID=65129 RepID=A0A8S1P4U6_9CILI|nr:unnamed protein product [Paramecium sonneborni]